jgi:hypothetical protein
MSGAAAWTATFISITLILKHVQYYTVPKQQRYIVRICLMIPIYAISSWFSYVFYHEAPYFEFIRSFYEAFVLASFFILLVNYLGDTPVDQHFAFVGSEPRRLKLTIPFCCISYNPANRHLIWYLKWGILQYTVIQPFLTVIGVIAHTQNKYCPESLSPKYANVYILSINFVSVTVAMYALITLYVTIKDELAPHRPFFKFLCVKLIVFFSFWQSALINILSFYNVIKPTEYWTKANIATGLNAILICFEMVVFALLHVKAFDYRVYRPKERVKQTIWAGLVDSLNPMDLVREIVLGARYLWAIVTRSALPIGGTYREESIAEQMNIERGLERAGTFKRRNNLNSNTDMQSVKPLKGHSHDTPSMSTIVSHDQPQYTAHMTTATNTHSGKPPHLV